MMTRSLSWLLLPVLLGMGSAREGQLTALALSSRDGTARLAISIAGPVTVHETVYHDPDRLVLDLEPATTLDLGPYDGVHRGAVVAVRVNQYKPKTVRVVLEFDRLPAYTLDRNTPGLVLIAFADQPFDSWSAGTGRTALTLAGAKPGTSDAVDAAVQADPAARPLLLAQQQQAPINVNFNKTWSVFGRYDWIKPTKLSNDNLKDKYYNVGIQWEPVKIVDLGLVYKHDSATGGLAIGNLGAGQAKRDEVGLYGQLRF